MDGQEEVLICGCTEDVGREDISQRKNWCVTQAYSTDDLRCDYSEYEVFGQRFWPAELGYLRRESISQGSS